MFGFGSKKEYSETSFWEKITKVGATVMTPALKAFYIANDSDTPLWAKTILYGALAYFISPADAIPDLIPGGYVDDIGLLTAAVATAAKYLKDEHTKKAKEKMRKKLLMRIATVILIFIVIFLLWAWLK